MARYIELCSDYRNRIDYPNVGEFSVPFMTDNQTPLSLNNSNPAFPIYEFESGLLNIGTYSPIPLPQIDAYFTNDSISTPRVFPNASIVASTTVDMFKGYCLVKMDGSFVGPAFVPVSIEFSLIVGWEPTLAQFTISPPFSSPPIPPAVYPYVPPPAGIVSYFAVIDLVSAIAPPWVVPGIVPGAITCSQYRDVYNRPPAPGVDINVGDYIVYENAPAGTPDHRVLTRYVPERYILTFDSPFPSIPLPLDNVNFSIRKDLPVQKNYPIIATPNPYTVQITPVSSFTTKDYPGKVLYIIPSSSDTTYPDVLNNKMTFGSYVYTIKSFDSITNEITLDRPIEQDLFVNTLNLVGRLYEILPQSIASDASLAYSGSLVSQADPVCYEIKLMNLTLPNVKLDVGSFLVNYSFVYLELRTEGPEFTMGRNIITSNNPNSERALFICPITNVIDPDIAKFIKITAFNMKQTVKFKPNAPLYMRIYLPNGKLFQPEQLDYPPPLPPNPLLQIEAIFQIERI